MDTSQFLLFLAMLLFTAFCAVINSKTKGYEKLFFWFLVLIGAGFMIGQLVAYIVLPILTSLL